SILLGGCATSKLWQEGRFDRYHEPANPPNVRLFHSSQNKDVLVQYDEVREDDAALSRRAYWLEQNINRLAAGRKPHFVSMANLQGLRPIPIAVTNATSPS